MRSVHRPLHVSPPRAGEKWRFPISKSNKIEWQSLNDDTDIFKLNYNQWGFAIAYLCDIDIDNCPLEIADLIFAFGKGPEYLKAIYTGSSGAMIMQTMICKIDKWRRNKLDIDRCVSFHRFQLKSNWFFCFNGELILNNTPSLQDMQNNNIAEKPAFKSEDSKENEYKNEPAKVLFNFLSMDYRGNIVDRYAPCKMINVNMLDAQIVSGCGIKSPHGRIEWQLNDYFYIIQRKVWSESNVITEGRINYFDIIKINTIDKLVIKEPDSILSRNIETENYLYYDVILYYHNYGKKNVKNEFWKFIIADLRSCIKNSGPLGVYPSRMWNWTIRYIYDKKQYFMNSDPMETQLRVKLRFDKAEALQFLRDDRTYKYDYGRIERYIIWWYAKSSKNGRDKGIVSINIFYLNTHTNDIFWKRISDYIQIFYDKNGLTRELRCYAHRDHVHAWQYRNHAIVPLNEFLAILNH